jgi:hypothetical protein
MPELESWVFKVIPELNDLDWAAINPELETLDCAEFTFTLDMV